MRQVLGIISLILLFVPRFSFAATYYVGKQGNDIYSCTQAQSEKTPKLTIQEAVNCATTPGDTVLVQTGTYIESVISWHSGTSRNPITVKAQPRNRVIWRGRGSDPESLIGAIAIRNQSHIRIEGFIFDGTVARATVRVFNATGNKTATPVEGIEIVNNTFLNNGNNGKENLKISRAIYLHVLGRDNRYTGGTVNTVLGNRFQANYGCDIYLAGTSDTWVAHNISTNLKSSKDRWNQNWFLARSIFVGNNESGYNSRRNIIEENVISHIVKDGYVDTVHEAEGIRLDVNADYNTFRHNVIHDLDYDIPWSYAVRSYGIYTESGCDHNTFSHNIIYNIGEGCMRSGSLWTTIGVGNQWLNNIGYNCRQAGFIVGHSQDGIFKNNILYNRGVAVQIYMFDVSIKAGGNIFLNNNYYTPNNKNIAVWNAKQGKYPAPAKISLETWQALSGDKGSLSIDPQFIDAPADFRLRPHSPVRRAGESGTAMGVYPDGSPP